MLPYTPCLAAALNPSGRTLLLVVVAIVVIRFGIAIWRRSFSRREVVFGPRLQGILTSLETGLSDTEPEWHPARASQELLWTGLGVPTDSPVPVVEGHAVLVLEQRTNQPPQHARRFLWWTQTPATPGSFLEWCVADSRRRDSSLVELTPENGRGFPSGTRTFYSRSFWHHLTLVPIPTGAQPVLFFGVVPITDHKGQPMGNLSIVPYNGVLVAIQRAEAKLPQVFYLPHQDLQGGETYAGFSWNCTERWFSDENRRGCFNEAGDQCLILTIKAENPVQDLLAHMTLGLQLPSTTSDVEPI